MRDRITTAHCYPPSERLADVWGGDEPEFEGMDEANAVLGAIMARYNRILHEVEQGEFAPLFDPVGTC